VPWWYSLLKTIHILSAITAVGANLTYGVWASRGRRDDEHLRFALRGIQFLDNRIANPAYGVLLVTGLIMTFTLWSITTRWILTGLILYVLVAVVGVAVISPALRKQIAALEQQGPRSNEYSRWSSRVQAAGMFASVVVIAIVFVMVFKPAI
jgi:uncharacterized membrane protein